MKTRTWKSIMHRASVDAFLLWLLEQPDEKSWPRENICACPLHEFIEDVTGYSIEVNSPYLTSGDGERESDSWDTPWWMVWILRSVDHSGDGRITKDELLFLALVMVRRDFSWPLMSPAELERAAA